MKKLLVVLFCTVLTFGVFASDFCFVHDSADLLSDNEEALVSYASQKVYDNSGLLCVVLTDYGVDVLNNLYDYAGDATDMLMLTVDMAKREFEIYQYNANEGEGAFCISYDESENILDSIFDDVASGNYADAALMFVEMAESAYVNAEHFVSGDYDGYEYVEYEDLTFGDLWLGYLIMSLGTGVLVGAVSVLIVWLWYKRKVHGAIYPLSQYSKLNITASKDNFVSKNVIVTHIPDPPSSSGSSGGSSGGGGARMGGRSF